MSLQKTRAMLFQIFSQPRQRLQIHELATIDIFNSCTWSNLLTRSRNCNLQDREWQKLSYGLCCWEILRTKSIHWYVHLQHIKLHDYIPGMSRNIWKHCHLYGKNRKFSQPVATTSSTKTSKIMTLNSSTFLTGGSYDPGQFLLQLDSSGSYMRSTGVNLNSIVIYNHLRP